MVKKIDGKENVVKAAQSDKLIEEFKKIRRLIILSALTGLLFLLVSTIILTEVLTSRLETQKEATISTLSSVSPFCYVETPQGKLYGIDETKNLSRCKQELMPNRN
ncbi:MAG: hypothetical protein N3E47_05045 [Candidatus Bathyarchaeota archaeon]|nr:hypothetical protein [Candidatus Bathyarchaeota archaeon]